jgi:aldose sugar dehydrogenase
MTQHEKGLLMKPFNYLTSLGVSFCTLLASQTALAQPQPTLEFKGLTSPWAIEFIADRHALITSKHGKLYALDLTTLETELITGLPKIKAHGQGGLLDIKKSPNFEKDHYLYVTYVKEHGDKKDTTLARAQLIENTLVNWQDLLVTVSAQDYDDVSNKHFGSRIAFDTNNSPKGHVFFSVGDRGHRPNGQDLQTHAGSIIRLNLDGSTPKDNPYVDNDNALNEIYSYGHRNPQGLAFDHDSSRLWAIEHGPRGGDELNLINKGNNYGWPVISYGKEYYGPFKVGESTHKDGMQQPVKYYVPSIAPSSLLVVNGDLLAGALAMTHVNHSLLNGSDVTDEKRYFDDLGERIRDVELGPDGRIYMITDNGNLYSFELNTD